MNDHTRKEQPDFEGTTGGQARKNSALRSGFTLIETMVVISLICVLTGLLATSINGSGRAAKLGYSGNQVVNLINLARQNSMSKNVMTALVVLTDPANTQANQALILLELRPPADGSQATSANWKPVSRWETLAKGSIMDKIVSFETAPPQPAFPSLKYGASDVNSSYSYIVFLPGGNLLNGASTSQIRLTEGFFSEGATAPTLTKLDENGEPLNTYNITILGATGRTKIDRS